MTAYFLFEKYVESEGSENEQDALDAYRPYAIGIMSLGMARAYHQAILGATRARSFSLSQADCRDIFEKKLIEQLNSDNKVLLASNPDDVGLLPTQEDAVISVSEHASFSPSLPQPEFHDFTSLYSTISNKHWIWFARGSSNNIFINKTKKWVLRCPLSPIDLMSNTERAYKNWNLINPTYPAINERHGLNVAYFGDETPTALSVHAEVIDIYKRTRMIIGDAWVPGNFLFYKGKALCVDPDLALHQYDKVSQDYVKNNLMYIDPNTSTSKFDELCQSAQNTNNLIMATVCTLLYLEKQMPLNEIRDEFITPQMIATLHLFRIQKLPVNADILTTLLYFEHYFPENIKLIPFDIFPHLDRLYEQHVPIDQATLRHICIYSTQNYFSELDWAIASGNASNFAKYTDARITANHLHSRVKNQTLNQLIKANDIKSVQILIQHRPILLNQINSDGYTPLHYAAFYGNIDLVRYFIAEGADLNTVRYAEITKYSKMTAMELTFKQNHILLLEKSAHVSSAVNHPYPIHLAARCGRLDLVQILIERDPILTHALDMNNQTALLWAASNGHTEIVKFFITQGVGVNIPSRYPNYIKTNNFTPLDWAISNGHSETIQTLVDAGGIANHVHSLVKKQTLKQLIEANDINSVKILIQHHAKLLNQLDSAGYTPLHYAAFYGKIDLVSYLIAEGADCTTVTPAAITDYANMTAMDLAKEHLQDSVAILLLEKLLNVSPAVNPPSYSIYLASKCGRLDLVQTLVGLDSTLIHARDSKNQTALLWAASIGHTELVKFLITQGADVNIPTQLPANDSRMKKYNRTPLDWAIAGGYTDTIQTLIDANGISNASAKDKIEKKEVPLVELSIFKSWSFDDSADNEILAMSAKSARRC